MERVFLIQMLVDDEGGRSTIYVAGSLEKAYEWLDRQDDNIMVDVWNGFMYTSVSNYIIEEWEINGDYLKNHRSFAKH